MPYTHYGKIGDVWKHLALCAFINQQKPRTYIESNSAFAWYKLTHSPEQRYGIGSFYQNIQNSKILSTSRYYTLVESINPADELRYYIGSPGLAMLSLRLTPASFLFFDIEPEPLEQVQQYAEQLKILPRVKIHNKDSISGIQQLLPQLTSEDFIHFDPYSPFEQNKEGTSYFDIFSQAFKQHIPCMLWYGYNTLSEKQKTREKMHTYYEKYVIDSKKDRLHCIEIYLAIIEEDIIVANPGILGCGVIAANLHQKSYEEFDSLSNELVSLYKDTLFNNFPGNLRKEIVS